MNRKTLEMKIERQIHALIAEVKEHVEDFTVLTVRKHHPDVNRDQLTKVLEIVRKGVDDGFMTKIDRFMAKLDKDLEEFSNEESPLDRPKEPATPSKRKKTS